MDDGQVELPGMVGVTGDDSNQGTLNGMHLGTHE